MPDIFDQLEAGVTPPPSPVSGSATPTGDIFDQLETGAVKAAALSPDLLERVRGFETFIPKAYGDYKQTSIGYGTRVRPGEKTITREDAEKRLQEELSMHARRIDEATAKGGFRLTPAQRDALISFDFNTGSGAKVLTDAGGDPKMIADKLLEYVHAGGKPLDGLRNRRKAERDWFLGGTSNEVEKRNIPFEEPSIPAVAVPFWKPEALAQPEPSQGDIFDQLEAAKPEVAKLGNSAISPQTEPVPTSNALEDAARRVPAEIAKVSSDTAAGALHAADMATRSPVAGFEDKGAFATQNADEYAQLKDELAQIREENARTTEGGGGAPDPRETKILQRLAELEKDPNVKRPLQAAADAVRDIGSRAKEEYGVDPARDSQVSSKVISGASSLVPIIASGPAAPLATAAMMGEQQRQDAEEHGAGEEAQNKSFVLGASVGAISEALLGIPSILRAAKAYKVPPETLKEFAERAVISALKSAPKEGAQEAIEQAAQNIIAKDIISYDPGRDRSEGVLESGLYGAAIGSVAGGGLQVATDADAKKAYEATDEGFAARIRKLRESTEGLAPAPETKEDFSEFPDGDRGQKVSNDTDDLPDDEIDPEVLEINRTNTKLAEEENQAEEDRARGAVVREEVQKEADALLPPDERAELTPEEQAEWEAARREYERDILENTDRELRGSTYELLEALKKVGHLPAVSQNKEAVGEMKRIWEAHPAARMKIFRKSQTKSLDTVREELEGYGFKFETAYDMLSAIENRVSNKAPIYGVQYSKRAQNNPKVQATPEQVEGWWKRTFSAMGPGVARQLKLKLGAPDVLVEDGIASREDLTGEEQAAYVAKLRTIYLLNRGSNMRLEDADVLDLIHETGHAWADTLGPQTRAEITKLFLAERKAKSGPVFNRKGVTASLGIDPRVGEDVNEWFAERVAFANFEWAKKRGTVGANDGSLIGRAAAAMRLAWLRLGEAVGGNRGADVITRKMREFLKKGSAALEASASKDGATAYTYAGRNASGYADAEKEGRTFTGPYDNKERFEIDDSRAKLSQKGLRELDLRGVVPLGAILHHRQLYNQYPDLETSFVQLGKSGDSTARAQYDPSRDVITVFPHTDWTDEKLRSTLLHEIQHAIQKREKFARGSNLDAGNRDYQRDVKTANDVSDALDLLKLSRKSPGTDLQDLRHDLEDQLGRSVSDEALTFTHAVHAGEMTEARLHAIMDRADDRAERLPPFRRYQGAAGEIESRDVQARADLNARERAQKPPFSSETWHPDDVDVHFSRRSLPGSQADDTSARMPQDNAAAPDNADASKSSSQEALIKKATKRFDIADPMMGAKRRKEAALGLGVWMTRSGDIIPLSDDHNKTAARLLEIGEAGDTNGLDAAYRRGWARVLIRPTDVLVSGNPLTPSQKKNLSDWALMHEREFRDLTEPQTSHPDSRASSSDAPQFSKRKTLTPAEEEALRKTIGDPPGAHVEFGPGRLYLGSADIFERTKGLEFLGKAIRRHVDRARMYQGKLTAPFRAWEQKHDGAARKKAYDEFERYQIANEKNRKAADNIRHLASPAGQELLQLWDEAAERIQKRNELRGLMVKGERGWRKIHKVSRYFPRSLKPEIRRMLNAPRKNKQQWDDLVVELVDAGLIKTAAEAKEFVRERISTNSKFDYLANVEAARRIPLPTKMYDYSFAAAQRYLMAWSERMAQIEAYGQKTTAQSQDLWDKAFLAAGSDKRTKEYIEAARERAFNVTRNTWVSSMMSTLNAIATGTMLGNPVTVGVNVASGLGLNAATFGTRNAFKGLLELRELGTAIDDAHEKGILLDDLMRMVEDSQGEESKAVDIANATAGFLLKWSGYNVSEWFVRAHSYVTARSFLREALKAHGLNPTGRAWRQYRAFMVRNGIDPDKVVAEKGSGLETDRFYRNAINAAQGGYRFDQVPIYVDTPTGRFLFKFQKYGTQAARHFVINFVKPMLAPGKGNPREIRGALRYAVVLALVGAGASAWKELFGTPDASATLGEIARTMKEDDRRGMALLTSKLFKNWLAAGAGGMFGNYAQIFNDVTERSKFKNPLNPPGIGTLANAGELALRAFEQGTLTKEDINELLRSQLSAWRTLQSAGANIAEAAGVKIPGSDSENARQDVAWLRTIARRFEDEAGGRPNRTSMGRVGKTPDSPTLRKLNEALISGDRATAKEAMKEYVDGRKNEAAKEIALQSLKSSVRSKQPIRIGASTSEGTRGLFLKWAQKRLAPEDVARIQKIDRTYRDTAAAVGLMSESKPVTDKAMEQAEQRISRR